MTDASCVALLQWALPRGELRWAGYRHVRGQVCKRIRRRVVELGLPDLAAYRARLLVDPEEWRVFERLCVVTISRFYRDRGMWDVLREEVLPAAAEAAVAAAEPALRCWSIGCASGEEPYTLSLAWGLGGLAERYPTLELTVLGTDIDENVLARARAARYGPGTLRELPPDWLEAFDRQGEALALRECHRSRVELRREDVRRTLPDDTFRLILCRNVIFTYFDEVLQQRMLDRILTRLADGGAIVAGQHERLPVRPPLAPWRPELGIYRLVPEVGAAAPAVGARSDPE